MQDIKILFVDDEVDFLIPLKKRLGKRGVDIEIAGSGEEGLARLEEYPADVVVLDVKMPGMDGLEALRLLKQKWPLVEVIMLSGHANVEVAIQGMELGAFDYLMKPVEFDELVYKLEDAYKRKKHQEERIQARDIGG